MQRKHRDVLLAALILIGATTWAALLLHSSYDAGRILRCVVWGAASFTAMLIARRTLIGLTLGQAAIAAVVAVPVMQGIFAARWDEPVQVETLVPIAISAVAGCGAVLVTRRLPRELKLAWRVLAAGLTTFGASLFFSGVAELAGATEPVVFFYVGTVAGAMLVSLSIEVRGRHCALGYGVMIAAGTLVQGVDVSVAIIGAFFAAGIAAIGGRIGAAIRLRRTPRPELPEAQVR